MKQTNQRNSEIANELLESFRTYIAALSTRYLLLTGVGLCASGCGTLTMHSLWRTEDYAYRARNVKQVQGYYRGIEEMSGKMFYSYTFPDPIWYIDVILFLPPSRIDLGIPVDDNDPHIILRHDYVMTRASYYYSQRPALLTFYPPGWTSVNACAFSLLTTNRPSGSSTDCVAKSLYAAPYPDRIELRVSKSLKGGEIRAGRSLSTSTTALPAETVAETYFVRQTEWVAIDWTNPTNHIWQEWSSSRVVEEGLVPPRWLCHLHNTIFVAGEICCGIMALGLMVMAAAGP
jgi:hypothetical protein